MDETVEQYLALGGSIKRYRSRADEIAANQIPRGKYCQRDAYIRALQAIKSKKIPWNKFRQAGDPPDGSTRAAQVRPGLTAKKNARNDTAVVRMRAVTRQKGTDK